MDNITICLKRHRIVATSELSFDRGAVGTDDFLTGEDDVGQARVLVVQGGTEQRRGRCRLARVEGAVVL